MQIIPSKNHYSASAFTPYGSVIYGWMGHFDKVHSHIFHVFREIAIIIFRKFGVVDESMKYLLLYL